MEKKQKVKFHVTGCIKNLKNIRAWENNNNKISLRMQRESLNFLFVFGFFLAFSTIHPTITYLVKHIFYLKSIRQFKPAF